MDLDEPCIERGGRYTYLKGLLAYLHNTTMPIGMKIHACHACNNKKCSNPNHLYWGTPSENRIDAKNSGVNCSVWDLMVKKYGLEEARRMQSRSGNQAGQGNAGKPKSEEHKRKIADGVRRKNAQK